MKPITRLPGRPLSQQDVVALGASDRLQVAPYGGIPDGDEVEVYALKLATGGTAHALGFDESRGRWQQLASVDAGNLDVADRKLDAVLDDWVLETYGGQFEVLKTV